MRVFFAALTVSLVVPFSNLSAQQLSRLEGARMRVTAPDCGMNTQTTTLQALRGDTLLFPGRPTESSNPIVPVKCPVGSVTRVEMRQGRKSNVARGALIGLIPGVVGGAFAGAHVARMEETRCPETFKGAVIGAGIMGALTAGLGAIVGALIKTDRWEEVPLDRLRVGFAPQRDRVSLGLRIAF